MKNLNIFIICLTFIISCGGGGGGSSETNPPVNIVNPSISSFSSSSQAVTVGDSVTLSWSSSNSTSCVASGDWSDSISTNDSIVKILNEAKTYNFTLTCSGGPGSIDAVSTISVEAISPQASSIDSFGSSATSILVNSSITLTWTTTAMSTCVAKGDWEGEKDLNDSETIQLVTVKTYEFILECTDADGNVIDESVSVIVNDETDQNLDVAIIDEGGIGANNEPSDLGDDLWQDLWWNLIAMVDPERAIADYNTVSTYDPEAGESKAHTYHWIHTLNALGHVQTGTGDLTANYPAAMAFKKNGTMNYLAYNFSDSAITVSYSNGKTMTVEPNNFKLESN